MEIKERKHRKYIRDKKDFETGQIYNNKSTYRPNHFPKSQVDLSESDISGTDEPPSANPTRFTTRKTKNKRSYQPNSQPYNKRPNYKRGDRSTESPQYNPTNRETCYQVGPQHSGGQSSGTPSLLTVPPQFFQTAINPNTLQNPGLNPGLQMMNTGPPIPMGPQFTPSLMNLGTNGNTSSPFLGFAQLPTRERDKRTC